MTTQIQVKRDTAAAWTTANPVLASGEAGFETDTRRMKYGDGVTAWTSLPYVVGLVGASANPTAAQSCANAVVTMLTFAAETFDTHGFHSTSVNTGRLTVPAGLGGLYRITGRVGFAATQSVGNQSAPILYKNGILSYDTPHVANEHAPGIDVDWNLAAGDYVELGFYHESGGPINTRYTASYPVTFLTLIRLGAL